VLHAGGVPRFDPTRWNFGIDGLVEMPPRFTWQEFRALPQTEVRSDFHCVTRWSRLNNLWKGVLFTEVLERAKAKPTAQHVLVAAEEGVHVEHPVEGFAAAKTCYLHLHTTESL
jgi:DMSO/TMAO reductase YedYZ molybdopterin-dependent catalytic subunit